MIHYLNYVLPLIEGASVVITAAFILFHLPFLRQGFLNTTHQPLGLVFLTVFFSTLAIYGTHAGMVISPDTPLRPVPLNDLLKNNDAILNFRDLVVVCAGLAGGFRVGLAVGLVAALERYYLGGNTALACASASLLSGMGAGLVRHGMTGHIPPVLAAITGSLSVLLQTGLILLLAAPFGEGLVLVQHIVLPVWLITAGGAALFVHVVKIIDSDRTKLLAHYNAQIEPHFLMNTLNAIRSLIRLDPDRARDYVTCLGEFMQATQHCARQDSVTVADELKQAQRYMDFQRLRFPKKIGYHTDDIDPALLYTPVPPRTLLTLLENALTHGRDTRNNLDLTVRLYRSGQKFIILELVDNGVGIPPGRRRHLGKTPSPPRHDGGGRALYNLAHTLSLLFGRKAQLNIMETDPTGTTVQLLLPSQTGEAVQ